MDDYIEVKVLFLINDVTALIAQGREKADKAAGCGEDVDNAADALRWIVNDLVVGAVRGADFQQSETEVF